MDGRTTKLVDYIHRALRDNTEKPRTNTNGAESSHHALPPADTTLDLSNKSIGELPIEVIEIIKDKVERLESKEEHRHTRETDTLS